MVAGSDKTFGTVDDDSAFSKTCAGGARLLDLARRGSLFLNLGALLVLLSFTNLSKLFRS
jgi:hypothetical protein